MKILLGNIFESKCTTLVNTVNCVGVMGKGIALEFKRKYPDMFAEYRKLCSSGSIHPGCPYLYRDLKGTSIINFPTKDNWRSPSRLSYVEAGLEWFRRSYRELGIDSVAFPPLGCGNGGLQWDIVGPTMYKALKDLPIDIEIYAPYGTPKDKLTAEFLNKKSNDCNTIDGKRLMPFNDRWLIILEVVRQVNAQKYALHVGRVIFPLICYVLTRSGINTGFSFRQGNYGPYSPEVKESITVLSNAAMMTEVQPRGQSTIETRITPDFVFDPCLFSNSELNCLEKTVDLFCRLKNTDQAEVMATVMFAYDQIAKNTETVTEEDILHEVLAWRKHWAGLKEDEIKNAVKHLTLLRWIKPRLNFDQDDYFH